MRTIARGLKWARVGWVRRSGCAAGRRTGRGNAAGSATVNSTTPTTSSARAEPLEARRLFATFTVNTLADSGDGSLRLAVGQANVAAGADVIEFDEGLQGTIALVPGDISITDSLEIRGPGAGRLTIRPEPGEDEDPRRIFDIAGTNPLVPGPVRVVISGLTLTGGAPDQGSGGAIFNAGELTLTDSVLTDNGGQLTGPGGAVANVGTLVVERCTFSDNDAFEGDGGGALYSEGPSLTVRDSAFINNSTGGGGSLVDGGAVFVVGGQVLIENSTFAGNTTIQGNGGGLALIDATTTIRNSTIAGNQSDPNFDTGGNGGGVYVSGGRLVLRSVLIADNIGQGGDAEPGEDDLFRPTGEGAPPDTVVDADHCLIEHAADGTVNGTNTNNLYGQDPRLGRPGDNGGPTPTVALSEGSPAIDAGSNPAELAADQRGAGFPRVSGAGPDIGALETEGVAPPQPALPELSIGDVVADERFGNLGAATVAFDVTLSAAATEPVTVTYATADGGGDNGATAGDDYAAVSDTLTIFPGETTARLVVPLLSDQADEGDEVFFLELSDVTGATLGDARGRATIRNVEFVSADDVTVTEAPGGATAVFAVRLSSPREDDVDVTYTTLDTPGPTTSATAGEDYTPVSGVVTIEAGETTATVSVPVLFDRTDEPDELMRLELSTTTEGVAVASGGRATIHSPPLLSVDDVTVTEPAGGGSGAAAAAAAVFTVRLSSAAAGPVTAAYATTAGEGTATAGEDYTAASGTVTIPAGQTTATVSVPLLGDRADEADETFVLDLSAATGDAVLDDGRAQATVRNLALVSLPLGDRQAASYTDADGTPVTVSLKGPGTGEVLLTAATAADAVAVRLTGTTARSTLLVRGAGGGNTTLGEITADGPLRAVAAPGVTLLDALTVGGPLTQLQINDGPGPQQIRIGAGGPGVSITLGAVTDLSIDSGSPIRSLRAAEWRDPDAAADTITAPDVASILSLGAFEADVRAGTIGKLRAAGALSGSDIRTTGGIGSVTAASMNDSRVFAGVRPDLSTLPTAATDFADPAARINSVLLRDAGGGGGGGGSSGLFIAAGRLGRLTLGPVTTADGGAAFGLAADRIDNLNASTAARGTIRLARLTEPSQSDRDGDFVVRVL